MSNEIFIQVLLVTLTCYLFVYLMVPIVKKIANHVGALDIPNERKVHKVPIPRLGGLAIYAGFLFGYMVFGKHTDVMNSILIGSFIIIITGIIDDIKPLSAKVKLCGQIAAALVVVFYGKILLSSMSAFGIYIDFGILSYLVTIIFILAFINCMNLIDGLDGLAAGISSIFFLTVGSIAIFKHTQGLDFILCFIMLGSCLGFLKYNANPASIFMGDTGSMFLGFIISVIALLGFKNVTMTSIIIPFTILAIPFLDTIFAIIRRYLKNESITKPDKFHIHHQLLNMNFSHRKTVLIICFIDSLFSLASIVYVLIDNKLGFLLYGILMLLVLIFVLKTNIIIEHDKSKFSLNLFKKRKN